MSAFVLAALLLLDSPPARAHDVSRQDHHCLALTLYWESRNDTREGMIAVAAVVLNRVVHPEFPDTVCAVVREGGETPPCQFSWWCDGLSDRPENERQWARARKIAREILSRPPKDPTGGGLFYHHIGLNVPWKVKRQRTAIIGRHAYYR